MIAAAQPIAAGALLIALLAYLAIAYAPRLKAKGDATSPVAAAATIAAAFLAGTGNVGLALASAAVIVFVLAMKQDVHGFVDRLDEKDIKALARFGIIALAVLPFLPDEPMGPYGAWPPCKIVVGRHPGHRLLFRRLVRHVRRRVHHPADPDRIIATVFGAASRARRAR